MKDYQFYSPEEKMSIRDHFELNAFHDRLIKKVVSTVIDRCKKEWGPPPSPFSFFIMGSGGRFEQGFWSDQDHGIIFEKESEAAQIYFLNLGAQITEELLHVGYKRCDGGVMASNPFWCKSLRKWKDQLTEWISLENWESIRYLLTFFDARTIDGKDELIAETKKVIFDAISYHLLIRIIDNTLFQKKGVGILGQLLIESHGPHAGTLNSKEVAFFPYVNAIRLLALKEKIYATSSLSRLETVSDSLLSKEEKKKYKQQFLKLLQYRILYADNRNYSNGHYLLVDKLSKDQKKDLKEIIKDGSNLFHLVRKAIEKGG